MNTFSIRKFDHKMILNINKLENLLLQEVEIEKQFPGSIESARIFYSHTREYIKKLNTVDRIINFHKNVSFNIICFDNKSFLQLHLDGNTYLWAHEVWLFDGGYDYRDLVM